MTQITTKNGRYYEWNGERYPSVTTVLSKGIPKPGLIRWSARFVAEAAVKQFDEWEGMKENAAIEYLAGFPDRRRNSSANLGSTIHAAAEAISKGEPLREDIPENAKPYLVGFEKFVTDFGPRYLYTETAVFNRTFGYAGTLDSIVRIGRTAWVLDTKTGNRIYPDTALQLAAYARCEFIGREGGEEVAMPPIKKGGILHLFPNGYSLVPVRIDDEVFDAFLAVKDVYYWSEELSKVVMREPLSV
jgi:hypothetical protein